MNRAKPAHVIGVSVNRSRRQVAKFHVVRHALSERIGAVLPGCHGRAF